MSHEIEVAAGAAVGGFARRAPPPHAAPIGAPCANCATLLQGPWCHACGQSGEDFHRSIFRLCGEMVEGLLHMDGRLWRTLPDLMLRPHRLTRAYLEGHRAPQIPPLRLFLVVLLMIFLVGGAISSSEGMLVHQGAANASHARGKSLDQLTPEERANVAETLSHGRTNIDFGRSNQAAADWLKDRVTRTLADPERFYLILEQWGERFAILMLPVSAVLLSILFIFQRRFYLFDHTIFSLHSLSALGVAIIAAMLLSLVIGDSGYLLLLPAPVHLFAHMRGVYRTSVFGTLFRMAVLFLGSAIAALVLIVGLIAVGLNGMGA